FFDCSSLTSITIPESVEAIHDNAFAGCDHLRYAYIPKEVEYISKNAFDGAASDFTIEGYRPSEAYTTAKTNGFKFIAINTDDNGFIYDETTNGTYSIAGYEGTEKDVVIPDKIKDVAVTNIGDSAFENCKDIERATIPSAIQEIPNQAFMNCENLSEVVIPNSVKNIAPKAFAGCKKLGDVTIPKEVESIGAEAFADCANLTIHGCKDSAAETYAKANNIPFVEINDKPTPTKNLYHGNIDGDEKVTSKDALLVLRASVKLEQFNEEQEYFADVNGNGKIESNDSLSILRYSVNLKDEIVTIGYSEAV
ncbi:MAG: leucine-rich repeat protein, partial [Clostridia bacterium]|nr:leucine-rich repeat protein [Clostridia bacterium]